MGGWVYCSFSGRGPSDEGCENVEVLWRRKATVGLNPEMDRYDRTIYTSAQLNIEDLAHWS